MQYGADVNAVDMEEKSVLGYAYYSNNQSIINYLVENGADPTNMKDSLLFSTAEKGNIKLVKYLIEVYGVDPNAKTYYGERTALMYAEKRGDQDMIDYLKSKGAK